MSAAIETALFANELDPWEYIIGEIRLNFISAKFFFSFPFCDGLRKGGWLISFIHLSVSLLLISRDAEIECQL